jgi:four helix bundle protein
MAKGDDIQERMIDFAVAAIKLCGKLPQTKAGEHMAGQLLRSGTHPGLHYGEVRGAESTNDFIHKLKVILKELNESANALEIIKRSEMVASEKVEPLAGECKELCKITAASIRTASRNKE